jgi:hypothetical protein
MIAFQKIDDEFAQEIPVVLRSVKITSERVGQATWSFRVLPRSDARCLLTLQERWLIFEAPLPDLLRRAVADTSHHWQLLQWNGRLSGGVKFALAPGKALPQLRAEVPLKCTSALKRWIPFVHQGFKQVFERTRKGRKIASRTGRLKPADSGEVTVNPDLRELCIKTGWNLAQRRSGEIFVELDVPGEFYQARVSKTGTNIIRVSVPMITAQLLSHSSKKAMALLLLRACRDVRMARASIGKDSQGSPKTRFEAILPCPISVEELHESFSALSVACRLCGREARALKHDPIADAYLAL